MYKRTLIRNFIVQYLKDNTTLFSDRVFGGRVAPIIEKDSEYPYLLVFTNDESVTENQTMYTVRELDLMIGVVSKSNDVDDLDSIVEENLYDVEKAMSYLLSADNVGTDEFKLIEDIYLESINISRDSDSQSNISKASMSFKITYYYQRPVGLVYSTLDDFDVDGSIANLIITNKGVPANV